MGNTVELDPAVQVLGDRALLCIVTSSMTGWPLRVLGFQRVVMPKYKDPSRSREVPYPKKAGLLPHVAIAESDMAVLELLLKLYQLPHYKHIPKMHFTQMLRYAAYYGRLEMLKWLHQELSKDPKWKWEPGVLSNALKNPSRDVQLLKWLCDQCPPQSLSLNSSDIESQIRRGNLDVIRFLHQRNNNNLTLPESAMNTAATSGHLEITKLLHKLGTSTCSTQALGGATMNGHLDVLRFLHEHRSKGCTADAMSGAAANGFLEVVEFLHEHRSEGCPRRAINGAVLNGDLEMVAFLHENWRLGRFPAWNDDYPLVQECSPKSYLPSSRRKVVNSRLDARRNHVGVVQFL